MIDAPSARSLSRSRTLLAGSNSPLVLQLIGGQYDGRTIELLSEKVSIGSADHCTLRLVNCQLRPVELFIMRGQAGAIVQNWSPSNLLNGRAFTDAKLAAGDRLSVGAVELAVMRSEVAPELESSEPVSPNQAPPEQALGEEPSVETFTDTSDAELARALETSLAEAQAEIEQVRQQVQSLRDGQSADFSQFQAERATWIDELTTARQLSIKLQAEVDRLATDQQAEFDQREADLLAELEQARTTIDQLQQAATATEAVAANHELWQAKLDESASQLEALQAEATAAKSAAEESALRIQQLEAEATNLRSQAEQLAGQDSAASNESAAIQERTAELDAREEQLEQQAAKLERAAGRLEQLQAKFDEQQEAANAQAAQAAQPVVDNSVSEQNEAALAEMLQLREQLDRREQELDHLERHLAAKEEELESRAASSSAPQAAQHEGETFEREHAETQPFTPAPVPVKSEPNFDDQVTMQYGLAANAPENEIEPAYEADEACDDDDLVIGATIVLDNIVTDHPDEIDQVAAEPYEQSSEEYVEPFASYEQEQETPSNQEPFQQPSPEAPVNVADILAKYSAGNHASEAEEFSEEADSEEPLDAELVPDPVSPPPAAAVESASDDDESIQQYMDQLMRRVRGESAAMPTESKPSEPVAVEPVSDTPTEPQPPQAAAKPVNEIMCSSQFTPRSSAPEKSDNLAKMRELANTSARTAIDTASMTRRAQTAAIHGVMAVVAAIAGVTLLEYAWGGMSYLHYAVAGGSFVMAAWWGYRAVNFALGKHTLPTNSLLGTVLSRRQSKTTKEQPDSVALESNEETSEN